MKKTRDPLIDILKGIGIVSVVIGHSGVLFPGAEVLESTRFVYLYHLMLFFFTAGAVYSPDKYKDPYAYIGRQLKGSLPLYWCYNFVFLIFHNFFSSANLLDIQRLSKPEFAITASGIFCLTHVEQLAGAMWFVPLLLFAKVLFSIFFQTAEKLPNKLRVVTHAFVVIGFVLIGLYTNYWGMFLSYYAQSAFLAVPVIYLGYLFKQYRHYVLKFANAFTCVASALLMRYFLSLDIGYIELSSNNIINPYLFYPVTILGLFFCVSLAVVIQRSRLMEKTFCYLGSISFHIMALHFLAFKCVDWLYGWVSGTDAAVIMRFPTAFNRNGLAYSIVGVAFPVLAVFLFTKFTAAVKNKVEIKSNA